MRLALVAFISILIYGCQSKAPALDSRISQLENQVSVLKAQNASLQQQNSDLQAKYSDIVKERNTCNARFERVTVLYDVGLFNNETKAWAIPADIEPVLATGKIGTYSHYDPKTQTETIHFKGKPAS